MNKISSKEIRLNGAKFTAILSGSLLKKNISPTFKCANFKIPKSLKSITKEITL